MTVSIFNPRFVSPQIPNLNIAILGISSSGKTSLFTGLHKALYNSTINGFGIAPVPTDGADINKIFDEQGRFAEVSFEKNGMQFAPNTMALQPIQWNFNLVHETASDKLPVCMITCLDYRGGLISHDIASDAQESTNELLVHVSCSEAIIVTVDSLALTKFSDINEVRRRSGIDYVASIIRLFANRLSVPRMTLLLAMTKVDAIDANWKVNQYAPLYEVGRKAASEVFKLAQIKHWDCGILPISAVGEGRAITTYTEPKDISSPYSTNVRVVGEPNPLNVGEALLFCIRTILQRHQRRDSQEIEHRAALLEQYWRSDTIARTTWAHLRGKPTPKEMAQHVSDQRDIAVANLRHYEPYLLSLSQTSSPVKPCYTS